jgi:hypothetical protein
MLAVEQIRSKNGHRRPNAAGAKGRGGRGGGVRLLYLCGTGATPFPEELPGEKSTLSERWKAVYRSLFTDIIFTPLGPAVPIPIKRQSSQYKQAQAHQDPPSRPHQQLQNAGQQLTPLQFNEDDLYGPVYEGKTVVPLGLFRPRSRHAIVEYARSAVEKAMIGRGSPWQSAPQPQERGILFDRDAVYVPVQVGARRVWVKIRDLGDSRERQQVPERAKAPLPPPKEWVWSQFLERLPRKTREKVLALMQELEQRGLSKTMTGTQFQASPLYDKYPMSQRFFAMVMAAANGYLPEEGYLKFVGW